MTSFISILQLCYLKVLNLTLSRIIILVSYNLNINIFSYSHLEKLIKFELDFLLNRIQLKANPTP